MESEKIDLDSNGRTYDGHVDTWKETQLTHNTSDNLVLGTGISPDGRYVAYVDETGLHLTVADTGETHDIALPDEVRSQLKSVSWFPDGQRLILRTSSSSEGDVLWLSSIFGGVPQKLQTHGKSGVPAADSSIAYIAADGREIWVSGPNGKTREKSCNPTAILPIAPSPGHRSRRVSLIFTEKSVDSGPALAPFLWTEKPQKQSTPLP